MANKAVTYVLMQSILRTIVPVVVGSVLGFFAAQGIAVDPELEVALTTALTGLGIAGYYVVARLLEVYVSPRMGVLLGSMNSPDSYSVGAPPVGQADEDESLNTRDEHYVPPTKRTPGV